jgi:hypothetical protein
MDMPKSEKEVKREAKTMEKLITPRISPPSSEKINRVATRDKSIKVPCPKKLPIIFRRIGLLKRFGREGIGRQFVDDLVLASLASL